MSYRPGVDRPTFLASLMFPVKLPVRLTKPERANVYGVMLNSQRALDHLGAALHEAPYKAPPSAPILYVKPAITVAGQGVVVDLPAGAESVCVSATLGLIIGQTTRKVSVEEADEHIAGFRIASDLHLPLVDHYRPAFEARCRDNFLPLGPPLEWHPKLKLSTVDIRVYINERQAHERRLDDLVRSPQQLIADVSDFMTLQSGDLLLLGLPHDPPEAGPGARVRIEVPGVGVLSHTIAGAA